MSKRDNKRIPAIILAGGTASPEFALHTGVTNRALAMIGDKTMLEYIVDAIHGAEIIDRILVVGDVPKSPKYDIVQPQDSLFANMLAGIRAAKRLCSIADDEWQETRMLVSTSDIPFITAECVDDFVYAALYKDVDFAYPIVAMDTYNRKFAGMKRTTLKLRENQFTGGNMVLVRSAFMESRSEQIQKAYQARKDVLKLGSMLGPSLLIRIILSQLVLPSLLDIPSLERGVEKVLGKGSRAAAIISDFAEIGTDVDKVDDIDFARKLLSKNAVTSP